MSPGGMMVALVTVEQQSGSFQDILEDKLIGYKTWGRTSTSRFRNTCLAQLALGEATNGPENRRGATGLGRRGYIHFCMQFSVPVPTPWSSRWLALRRVAGLKTELYE